MQIYLVGGAVRDRLLGLEVVDRDWVVVGATPQHMLAQGFLPVGQDFPVFLHPQTHEEYALARTERKSGRGYKGFQVYAQADVTLEEDLLRRDLTINAMAQTADGKLIDPYGGQRDCEQRWLRPVSAAFAEDPLRVLRLARFAARFADLGFRIHPEARALVAQLIEQGELAELTRERVAQEVQRAVMTNHPEVFFAQLDALGALSALSPDFAHYWQAHAALLTTRLQMAVSHHAKVETRLALLLYGQDPAELTQQQAIWGWPKAALALVAKMRTAAQHAIGHILTPENLIDLLDQLDAWRQPEPALHAVEVLSWIREDWPVKPIAQAYHLAAPLSAKAFVEAGLRGPAVGQALRQQRQEKVGEVLFAREDVKLSPSK
ncbi:polynucleotide adenylyltransferase [Marinospirillum sp. MEB164]|uniref:Polynucleotide adenylyltransferase n=1 Tax=Marinospirillum alkalitolerans TaxID=3123374 RepID=A0ABW8PW22_9GAMM